MAIKIVWDAVTLKQLVLASRVTAEDVSLFCTPEGIKVNGLSEHKIIMISAEFPSSSFKEFICDESFSCGLKIEEIKQIVKRFKKSTDLVTMTYNPEESRLVFEFDNKKFSNRIVEMKISRDVPNIPLSGFIEVNYEELADILKDAGLGVKGDLEFEDVSLDIELNDNKIKLFRHTVATDYEVERIHDEKTWSLSGYGKVKIQLYYLAKPIDELSGTIDKVKLSIGDNTPMMMEIGQIKYLIAPRQK